MDTQNQTTLLPLGTQVTVSNGEPRPPERFHRKLATWQSENFAGVLVKIEGGRYTVQKKPAKGWRPNDVIIIFRSYISPDKVSPIAGACPAPLKTDGFSTFVDCEALIALEATPESAAA